MCVCGVYVHTNIASVADGQTDTRAKEKNVSHNKLFSSKALVSIFLEEISDLYYLRIIFRYCLCLFTENFLSYNIGKE